MPIDIPNTQITILLSIISSARSVRRCPIWLFILPFKKIFLKRLFFLKISLFIWDSSFTPRTTPSINEPWTWCTSPRLCFLICLDHRRNGFGRETGAGFARMLTILCIQILRIGQFIEFLSDLRDQCIVLIGGFAVGVVQTVCHLVIAHFHLCHSLAVFLISPGGK